MTPYYKMNFVSPNGLYAEVKQTLRSYFESGIVDDLLFPLWTDHCLKKFKMSAYKIEEILLPICGYQSCLPEGFHSVREAWAVKTTTVGPMSSPNSLYYRTDCRVTNIDDPCNECFTGPSSPYHCDDCKDGFPCDKCTPFNEAMCNSCSQKYVVTHKQSGNIVLEFQFEYYLKPATNHACSMCHIGSPNLHPNVARFNDCNSFDIRDGKMFVTFESGHVYLTYYSDAEDENQNQLVPDNEWVQDYIRKFLMYKSFEQVFHTTSDESFNQSQAKMMFYKTEQEQAFIVAETELKKETPWEKAHQIAITRHRYDRFNFRRRH